MGVGGMGVVPNSPSGVSYLPRRSRHAQAEAEGSEGQGSVERKSPPGETHLHACLSTFSPSVEGKWPCWWLSLL